jgi:hypothetical protein
MFFHPLTEDIRFGLSEVLNKYIQTLNINTNYRIGTLILSVMKALENPETHKHLNKKQSEFLYAIKDLDGTASVNFAKVLSGAFKKNADNAFINIYTNRKITIGERSYPRAAVVNFSFLSELESKADMPYGVKIRKKDIQTFKTIFDLVFPNNADRSEYSRGSDSKVAPFLDAVVRTGISITEAINNTCDLFKDKIDDIDLLVHDYTNLLQDLSRLNDFNKLIRLIPPQTGNSGVPPVGSNEEVAQPAASNQVAYAPPINMEAYNKPVVMSSAPSTPQYTLPPPPLPSYQQTNYPAPTQPVQSVSQLDAFRSRFGGVQQPQMTQRQLREPAWAGGGQPQQMQNGYFDQSGLTRL